MRAFLWLDVFVFEPGFRFEPPSRQGSIECVAAYRAVVAFLAGLDRDAGMRRYDGQKLRKIETVEIATNQKNVGEISFQMTEKRSPSSKSNQ